jgi:alkenylglycerophosphocholine hydrolase
MITPLFWAAAVLAVLDWVATGLRWKAIRFFTKPGTLLALLLWFVEVGGMQGALLWFGIGLIFSLVGDIMLMLPARFFISGLIAFLLAHVFYIFGFDLTPLPIHWGTLLALAAVLVSGIFLIRKLRAGMCSQPTSERMQIPVYVYGLVISLMLFTALLTLMRPEWPLQAALYASIGAALFYTSDTFLAYSRFCRPLHGSDLIVMITYHLGQFSIASAALIAFSG